MGVDGIILKQMPKLNMSAAPAEKTLKKPIVNLLEVKVQVNIVKKIERNSIFGIE